MKCAYQATTEGAVALVAATAKTVIGIKANAAFGIDLKKFHFGFDGVTGSAVPVFWELCYCTWATNAPGTNSTSTTPTQVGGRVMTHGVTSGKTWTTEPTTLTVIKADLITPAGGILLYDYPLGDTPDCALSEGFALRLTAPAAVNVRAGFDWERC